MATDATGTATSPDAIPTYNTAADAPSGKGLNNIVAALQTALSARIAKSLLTTTGDVIYASGASIAARLGIGSTGQVLTVAGGVPTWASPAGLTVATTVAGLGAGVDGKQGRIRLGSSPYEFIDLTYDATYGKWVSAPVTGFGAGTALTSTGNQDWTQVAAGIGGSYGVAGIRATNYADAITAGLVPQIRVAGWVSSLQTGASLTVVCQPYHISSNAEDVASLAGLFTTPVSITGGGSNHGFDSGWISVTTPGSPKAILLASILLNNTSGASTTIYSALQPRLRWVA